jgi:hypothetical protein
MKKSKTSGGCGCRRKSPQPLGAVIGPGETPACADAKRMLIIVDDMIAVVNQHLATLNGLPPSHPA